MARPQNVNTYRLGSLWVRPEVAERLRDLSQREGRSLSELLREALSEYLKRNQV